MGVTVKKSFFGSPPGVGWASGGVKPMAETYGFRYRRKGTSVWCSVICPDHVTALEAEQDAVKRLGLEDYTFDTLDEE